MKRYFVLAILTAFAVGCGSDTNNNSTNNSTVVVDLGNPDTDQNDTDVETDMGSDTDTVDVDIDEGGNDPDMDSNDVGDDTSTEDMGPDMTTLDPFLTCQMDCNYMGPQADMMDCDFDGLSQTEEAALGTDPCDNDTDGDNLSDLNELQEGTDPLVVDSDGDGLDDADEIFFGFNPNNADSLGDGILDGDRWIVSACNEPITSEPADYYTSSKGDWQVALPPAFNNYSELTIATALPTDKIAASVFDDPANEVAGFLASKSPTAAQTSPVDVLLDTRQLLNSQFTVQQESTGGEFTTHDFNQAAIGRYLIRSNQLRSARQVRDQILFATSPFASADVTGLPNSAGNTYQDFRVFVSVTYREDAVAGDRLITSVAIAPSEKFDTRDKVQFRMDDLSNTTNVSQAQDDRLTQCVTFRAGEGNPEANFYWVLDHSGSMNSDYAKVTAVANQFFGELQNTALDYLIAVTTMLNTQMGRPRGNVAWFTDLPTFQAEIGWVQQNGFAEYGLRSAQEGITWMRSSSAPQSLQIRPSAQLITIFMSDEEAQTIQDSPLSTTAGQMLLNNYNVFFQANSIVFSIVTDDGEAYRQVALATGGSFADLDAADISETIEDIIFAATGLASNYRINNTPISSTLRVFKNNEWVPRSRENGFDYFAQTNSIAFFGTYRPVPADPLEGRFGDDIAVSYQTFRDTTK